MMLDQNHSREDPDGWTVCHKSGWTSEKGAQGMIQSFVPQHPKGERSVSDSLVRITLCPRPVMGTRPSSAPISSHENPSNRQSNKNACFADHLLLLSYSGFVFPFRILFAGHRAECWALGQANRSLSCSHPATQNTRSVPPWQLWLPGGFMLPLAARTCPSRHHPWPRHLHPRRLPLRVCCMQLHTIRSDEQSPPAAPCALV